MAQELEMIDIGLISYYLGIKVKQTKNSIFISQEGYVKEVLKKFDMNMSNLVNTSILCGVKLSRYEGEKVGVGSLCYLTCTRPNIIFGVGPDSCFIEAPTMTHIKTSKQNLPYMKGILDYGLYYLPSNNFNLIGYSDSVGVEIWMIERAPLALCFLWEIPYSLGPQRSNLS